MARRTRKRDNAISVSVGGYSAVCNLCSDSTYRYAITGPRGGERVSIPYHDKKSAKAAMIKEIHRLTGVTVRM